MDIYEHTKEFLKLRPATSGTTYASMLENEARAERERVKRMRYEASLDIAASRMIDWYKTAQEYAVNTADLSDVAKFVGSHRPAVVWCVLLGKADIQAQARADSASK